MQNEQSSINEKAWNRSPYEAWLNRYGTPAEAAEKIKADPLALLSGLYEHLGGVEGKKAVNLLGSHGCKAVALALLGARVTVVDIASENARYARELAEAAGVPLRYLVSDVTQLPEEELDGSYDIAFMEFGILHYFTDLAPLMNTVYRLLRPGGRLVLQDFHPFTTKLISSKGTRHTTRKHKVTGDYFDEELTEVEVPYLKFLPEDKQEELPKTLLRRWTLGEIVTSCAQAGLVIRLLLEEPNKSSEVYDKGIPKTFTLVADRP
ncbi:methyltransferase domain-containing protein [Paenibacillus sp. CC-CFT747]|nr:methyltransferase domain-containing protein [Paenibacillus sp. CC-CFT747]